MVIVYFVNSSNSDIVEKGTEQQKVRCILFVVPTLTGFDFSQVSAISILIKGRSVCLSVCVSVCVFTFSDKTTQPILTVDGSMES